MGLPAQGYLLKVQAQSLKLLAILAFAALLRPVSPQALALSLALSLGGVLCCGALLRRSSNPVDVPPAVLFSQGSWGFLRFYLHFQARPLTLALVLALSSRSFGRWYLTHWRSFAVLSVGSSIGGTSRTSASPGAVDRADDIPALWQMIVESPFNLGHLYIEASFPWLLLWC